MDAADWILRKVCHICTCLRKAGKGHENVVKLFFFFIEILMSALMDHMTVT